MLARNELINQQQTRAAITLQTRCCQYLAHSHFSQMKKAALATQCAWRGRLARRELRKLKMAAKETGALQAAKNKLEKQVEELTRRLQLERKMRADVEEARNLENAKLQTSLDEMHLQFKETKEFLIKEPEISKKVLEAMVSSLENKIDETEKKYEETNRISEERLKQAGEAETKIIQLKTVMQSLEEKLFDMEIEDKILRQKVVNSPVKPKMEHLATAMNKNMENEYPDADLNKVTNEQTFASKSDYEADNGERKLHAERQRESVDSLIKCVMQNIGFSQGKPVAAFTLYKCLVHWKSFEAERTSVFDCLIQMIGFAIENEENNPDMAYWLSNASTLLFLLQRSLKSDKAEATPPKKHPPTSLFGRMTQGFRSSPSANPRGLDVVRQVEAKYPAMLFNQQLTAYVENFFGIIRDNLKKELQLFLTSCIQAPRSSKAIMLRSSSRSFGYNTASNYWHNIIDCLNSSLDTLQENHAR